MKNILYLIICAFSLSLTGCKKDSIELQPKSILTEDQVWNDPVMINDLLANYYDRLPVHNNLNTNERYFAETDEAVAVSGGPMDLSDNNIVAYPYSRWSLWDYDLVRDINLAIEAIDKYSVKLDVATKTSFNADFRFLRAYNYFELAKRMGGVPIVTTQLIYDYSGDPSILAMPRSKEEEIYDFIASECDAIRDVIGHAGSQTRANKYSVLALKCRAMLYAGSIAKYNSLMTVPITLPGKEVGIPAARANGYYQAALDAAKAIISSAKYSLYVANPDPKENFFEAIVKKTNNPEVIMAMDFNNAKKHNFAYDQICRTMREDNLQSSGISPSLNLVEAYKYLDGTQGTLKGVGSGTNTAAGQAAWIFYNKPEDIFANKDARLYGTIIYPGASFKGVAADIQAGVYAWNATANK